MASLRHKNHNKKKSTINPIPELTTAQLTFNKTIAAKPVNDENNINIKEILDEVETLCFSNESLEAINLLKGLKEYLRNTKHNDQAVFSIIHVNLGVCYYKAGFL